MPGDRRTWAGALRTADDVRKVLDDINQQGLTRGNTTALARAVQHADDVELGPDLTKLLPADDWLSNLLPWPGLPRGATIGMVGSTTLLLALIAAALRDGGYAAAVGLPHLGALAALQDHKIPGDRLEDGGFADSCQISMRNSTE